ECSEVARRIPAVDCHPPAAGLSRPVERRAEIALGFPEQRRPHTVRAVGERELVLAVGRRSELPDSKMRHVQPLNSGDGAQERTRTSTPLRAPAPEAGASTNSATWARSSFWQGAALKGAAPALSI